jgi:membrane fusion protein (multidrug efflux system)
MTSTISPTRSETPPRSDTPPPEAETPRPSKRRWFILAAVIAIVAVGAFFYFTHSSGREETDDAQLDAHLHAVSARISGTVVSVKVNDNQFVKAGDVLFEIDPRDYQVAVDRARADLAEARAEYTGSNAGLPITRTTTASQVSSSDAAIEAARAALVSAEKQVEAARARVQSAQAVVREAASTSERNRRDLERYRALLAKDEISRQQFDATAAAAEASTAQVEGANAQVREAEQAIDVSQASVAERRAQLLRTQAEARATTTGQQQVAVTQARVQSAAAKVMQMQSALERAELNLSYTVVRAAVDGLVSQRTVEVGQVIQPGQSLLSVVPLNDVWVTANFKENQLAKMRPGQRVEIRVDAAKGRKFTGKVDSIAAATGSRFSLLPPENATGNYVKVVQRVPVKIVFDPGQDPDHRLRPGMSAVPTVFTK